MADSTDSFFEGLDDAEPTPDVAPEPAAEPVAAAEKPADKAPEAAKPDAKPADKPTDKAPEVVAEAAKPAAIVAPEVKAPEQPDPRKWVPVGAHVELRDQLKAMRAELDAIRNPPKPKPDAPDFIQDPKGYVDHQVKSALEQLESGTKTATQTAEQANASAGEARFHMALNAAEQSFVSRQPDYYNALAHLREVRAADIRLLNPEITQQELQQAIGREELQLAGMLMQSGRNPSEIAYNLARSRGYSPPKPAEPAKPEVRPAAPEKIAALLPPVPEPAKLAPDLTLGTGTGSPVTSDIEEDPFEAAFKEMFGSRKRA
jgi:hypothetical protein